MNHHMNRRNWIRTSAMLAGGATLLPGVFNRANANATPALPYSSTVREEVLLAEFPNPKARLFANENPFGPSEKAKKAIVDALAKSYQYPFNSLFELQGKIAAHEGVKPEQVILGAGSSPLLRGTALHVARQGGNVITGDPTYEDLPEKATAFKTIEWIKVPLTNEYKLDLDEMEKRINDKTVMVYICNPNNPTGTQVDTAKLKAFCERVSKKVLVFVDEAYIDYTADPKATTLLDCVKKGQNVVVARTFSKLYGFAGLRIGYAIGQPEFVTAIEPHTAGFECISATTGAAALAAYQDTAFLTDALKKTAASKEFLYSVLKKEGYTYIPSTTNFVMFPLNMDAVRFSEEMMKRSVGVRPWKFAGKEWCRVSIGTMEEMEMFAQAFKQVS